MDIRPIRGIAEYRAVEDLQREVWKVSDLEVVPAVHMIPAIAVGAILLGAFENGSLLGFVYGFPGFEGDERVIHSDMLAVQSSHRDRGLGRKLKLAQREQALAQDVHRITWTFDPLQSRNAYLNLVHLGVTADRYIRDFYGETTSPLHALGTDRLWVTWNLDSAERRAVSESVRIEIPTDVMTLSRNDAMVWRDKTRRAFEETFAGGYIATGFERGAKTSSYVLTKK